MDDAQHEAAEIPHVARVVAAEEQVANRGLHLRWLPVRVHLAEEVPEERKDVLRSLAQARQVQGATGDPVVEVVAEGAFRLLVGKVAIGGADEPEGALAPRVAPDPLERALLDDPQQLGLEGHRELADLVEEERAAVRQLERALAGGGRAGERPLLMAEELAPGQGCDHGAAVQDHQPLLARPRVELVDELGDRSFPVPLSPVISTAASVKRATSTASRSTACHAGLSPTRKSWTWRHSTNSSMICQRRSRSATCRAESAGSDQLNTSEAPAWSSPQLSAPSASLDADNARMRSEPPLATSWMESAAAAVLPAKTTTPFRGRSGSLSRGRSSTPTSTRPWTTGSTAESGAPITSNQASTRAAASVSERGEGVTAKPRARRRLR